MSGGHHKPAHQPATTIRHTFHAAQQKNTNNAQTKPMAQTWMAARDMAGGNPIYLAGFRPRRNRNPQPWAGFASGGALPAFPC